MKTRYYQGYSRPAMDRMYRIHQLLQNREYPNSRTLAVCFVKPVKVS